MRGLEEKGIVRVEKNSDIDYDILILNNDFTKEDSFKKGCEGFITLDREVFHKKQFKRLKAKEKWLLLYFCHCTHENTGSYRIGTAKKQITINIDSDTIDYFKKQSENYGIPYQILINLYLSDCVKEKKELQMSWK